MTEQERAAIKQMLQDQARFHQANPLEARAFLLQTGIYTSAGELAPEYGGPDDTPAIENPRPR
jgi:hypothetical protein